MYNFDVPSTLRAYFDHIARAGVTFRYTALGPEGLLKGKKTTVIVTRGGSYAGTADTHTSYLKQFLGFIGLTDIEWVVAEKLAIDEATRFASVEAANDVIGRLQPASVAAA
jgi:FMN-dependent NADH-azoreductase